MKVTGFPLPSKDCDNYKGQELHLNYICIFLVCVCSLLTFWPRATTQLTSFILTPPNSNTPDCWVSKQKNVNFDVTVERRTHVTKENMGECM